jgi:hypothetical protein
MWLGSLPLSWNVGCLSLFPTPQHILMLSYAGYSVCYRGGVSWEKRENGSHVILWDYPRFGISTKIMFSQVLRALFYDLSII